MAFERKAIGEPVPYEGSFIQVRHMGPDLLAEVDGIELAGFYIDSEAAVLAGTKYIDSQKKAAAETLEAARKAKRKSKR